ncbi:MAG: GNAT family N-acetyltransferase [Methylosarcina sp.]
MSWARKWPKAAVMSAFKCCGKYPERALDYLCENGRRVFYVTGLAVGRDYRRRGIAERLSLALLDELRRQGFFYRLGRTDLAMASMRNLYMKLGFRELPITDANYPERSYWLLEL